MSEGNRDEYPWKSTPYEQFNWVQCKMGESDAFIMDANILCI